MRRLIRALCLAALVMPITACGESTKTATTPTTTSVTSVTSVTSTTIPTTMSTATPTTTPGNPAVFPLTITRIGGIAGFQDVLVVAGDGLVSVSRKGQKWQCRLTSEAVAQVEKAAAGVGRDGATPASTLPAFPDDLVSTVRSPAGGPVRLEDPKVGAGGRVVQELLNDLINGPAASRMCEPV